MSNESIETAKDYINYAKNESLSGTFFRIEDDYICIYQETDDSEEDGEGPDKYFVLAHEVDPVMWGQILEVAKNGVQW